MSRVPPALVTPPPIPALSCRSLQRVRVVDSRLLRRVARHLLSDLLQANWTDLNICLLAGRAMTRLNETYLRHAGSTDVITFDYSDRGKRAATGNILRLVDRQARRNARAAQRTCVHGAMMPGPTRPEGSRRQIHGEIFICVDEAVAQARQFRTSWQCELVRYLIHGVLHLLGYDDRTSRQRKSLKRAEDSLLREILSRFDVRKLGPSTLAK